MNRTEIKNLAKEQIRGNIGILFVITILIAVISFLANTIIGIVPYVGPIASVLFVTAPFLLSQYIIYLNLINGKKPEIKDAFSGFNDFFSAFKTYLLMLVFTLLWSLLFIIPGIIKAYSYYMSMYILAENKGMSAREAISKSKQMMHGHKMELFVLELSFIGWGLLVAITFGIAAIWVVPYMQATYANFYKKLTEEPVLIEA